MIKTVITGNPDHTAQNTINKLHEQFLDSDMVDEPAWAKSHFRSLRRWASDNERAERLMHGQCTGEHTIL